MKSEPYITINISTQFFIKVGKILLLLFCFSFIVISTVFYKPFLSISVIYTFTLITSLLFARFYSNPGHKYILAPLIINAFICFIAVEQAKQIADIAVSYQAIKKVFFIIGSNFVISVVLKKQVKSILALVTKEGRNLSKPSRLNCPQSISLYLES